MSRITIKDLRNEVDRINKEYFSKTKHYLFVQGAYGGYQVEILQKPNVKPYFSGGWNATYGFLSPRECMFELFRNLENIKHHIKRLDKNLIEKRKDIRNRM